MTLKEKHDRIVNSYMSAINMMESAGNLTAEIKAMLLEKMGDDIALATEVDNATRQYIAA